MKKKGFLWMTMLMVAMVCAGFASCSSDDDDEEGGGASIDAKALVGTWQLVSEDVVYDDGRHEVYTDGGVYLNFSSDNVATNYEWCDGYWDIMQTQYSVKGNKLTAYNSYASLTYEVLTLNSTTLTLKYNDEGDICTDTYKKVSDSVLEDLQ